MNVQTDIKNGAEQRFEMIRQTIEELRPVLRADGGDCELVRVEADMVYVRMSGACVGCQFSGATLGGVRERLVAKLGSSVRVIPVPSVR